MACRSGGMELLFGNQKTVEADVPAHNGGQVRRVPPEEPAAPPALAATAAAADCAAHRLLTSTAAGWRSIGMPVSLEFRLV